MLLKKDASPKPDYLQDWPAHYYEIENADERKEVLEQAIALQLDPEHDRYRLKILQKRFYTRDKKKTVDAFMHAWIMIKASSAMDISFFNRKRLKKELLSYMEELCLLNYEPETPEEKQVLTEEWNAFAVLLISSCAGSRAYRSILFGIATINDTQVAGKLAEEINLVTGIYPSFFECEEAFLPFRRSMIDTYCRMIENGEEYWRNIQL